MSGHSKWATTKRKKAAVDAKRAKIFTKLASLITIAARDGKSGDPNFNPSLRVAIDNARAVSMPKENIDRAIKRGTGEGGEASRIEEVTYEAYGPHGVALLIECLTDNRNRTIGEIKAILNKSGGSIAGAGSVAYQFTKMGEIAIDEKKNIKKADELEIAIIDSGADDFDSEDGYYVVRTTFTNLHEAKKNLEAAGVVIESAQLVQVPATPVELPEGKIESIDKIVESLEDIDDIVNVYTNLA